VDLGRDPGGGSPPERLPRTPSPRTDWNGVHSALDQTPYRVPHHLPAIRPVGRIDSPEVSVPYDDVTRTSPMRSGGPSTPPRSRPQVFSTSRRFPGRSGLAALFRAAAAPGSPLPSELHLAGIAAPLSGPPAPSRSSPRVDARRSRPGRRGFHRRLPHLWGASRYPPATSSELSAGQPWMAHLPFALDRARRARAQPHGSPASKPRSSSEVRAADPTGFPAGAAVLSWDFAPPEPSPPVPRTLVTRHALGAQHSGPRLRTNRTRHRGPRDPRVG
jgi:hypothetical protein